MSQHIKIEQVCGIESKIDYFDNILEKELKSKKLNTRGYSISHHKISCDGKFITIEVYTSGKIVVKGSPSIQQENFEAIANRVIEIAKRCIVDTKKCRPVTLNRAKDIMEYISGLDLSNEYQRMVAVILSDLVNEIILVEIMKSKKIDGPPLKEGIPKKIEYLKKKGVSVFNENGIVDTRELRNKVVHQGEFPSKTEAEEAIRIANKVLGWVL